MIYLKTKFFNNWAKKNNISNKVLSNCADEAHNGQYEASIGHKLFKKRIPAKGKGKSGGARTILFYQKDEKLIFCIGFAKNVKSSLDSDDKKLLYKLSRDFEHMNKAEIERLIKLGSFIEIEKE